jgi:hypothetical protein
MIGNYLVKLQRSKSRLDLVLRCTTQVESRVVMKTLISSGLSMVSLPADCADTPISKWQDNERFHFPESDL